MIMSRPGRVLAILTGLLASLAPFAGHAQSAAPVWPAQPVWLVPAPLMAPPIQPLPFPIPFWLWPALLQQQPPMPLMPPLPSIHAAPGAMPPAPAQTEVVTPAPTSGLAAPVSGPPERTGDMPAIPIPPVAEGVREPAPASLESAPPDLAEAAQPASAPPGRPEPSTTESLVDELTVATPAAPSVQPAASESVLRASPAAMPEIATRPLDEAGTNTEPPAVVSQPESRPARKPAASTTKSAKPARKPATKPASKSGKPPRKLCWKDGRLDVCP